MRPFLFFSGLTLLSLAVFLGTAQMQHKAGSLAIAAADEQPAGPVIRNLQHTRAPAQKTALPTAGPTQTPPTLLITLTRGSQPKGARFVRPPARD